MKQIYFLLFSGIGFDFLFSIQNISLVNAASFTFSDGTFNNADWTAERIQGLATTSFSAQQNNNRFINSKTQNKKHFTIIKKY